jgi:hypothetical protein
VNGIHSSSSEMGVCAGWFARVNSEWPMGLGGQVTEDR